NCIAAVRAKQGQITYAILFLKRRFYPFKYSQYSLSVSHETNLQFLSRLSKSSSLSYPAGLFFCYPCFQKIIPAFRHFIRNKSEQKKPTPKFQNLILDFRGRKIAKTLSLFPDIIR